MAIEQNASVSPLPVVARDAGDSLITKAALAVFLILLFALYASGITDGMAADGTDWAMYVMHARNIVTGHAYADTGYVVQPETIRQQGASTYPSGYALLLAPFYAVFGLNMHVFKLLNDALLVLSLWLVFLFARRTLPAVDSFVLIAVVAFSGLYLYVHNMVGSDAPYQFLSFLVLLILQRVYDSGSLEQSPWKLGLLVGFMIALAYLTRPIGMVFLISVIGTELIRKRRPTMFLVAIFVAFIPLLLLNNLFFHKDVGYSDQFVLSVPGMIEHTFRYLQLFSYTFNNPVSHAYRYLLAGVTLVLAILGLAKRLRTNPSVVELYFFTNLGVLSVYWGPQGRYLLPILPIYLIYALEGFRILLAYAPPRAIRMVAAVAVVACLLPAVANVVTFHSNQQDTLITAPLYEKTCTVLEAKTAPKELLVFWNPRVLALFTGRFASDYPFTGAERVIAYLKRIRPNYIVVDKDYQPDREYLIPALKIAGLQSDTIYENPQFQVLKILDSPNRAAQ